MLTNEFPGFGGLWWTAIVGHFLSLIYSVCLFVFGENVTVSLKGAPVENIDTVIDIF